MRINSNIPSLQARTALQQTQKSFARALERLSSGRRLNRFSDDVASSAVSISLEASIRGLRVGSRNLVDAKSLLNVTESQMRSQLEIVQRMRDLALQSSNGGLKASEHLYLDQEFQNLLSEFNRMVDESKYQGLNLLEGGLSGLEIDLGTSKNSRLILPEINTSASELFLSTRATGDFISSTVEPEGLFGSTSFGADLAVADFNADGILDFIAKSYQGDQINTFLGDGEGSFTFMQSFNGGAGVMRSSEFVFADFNDDGHLDYAAGGTTATGVSIGFGNGDGTFGALTTIAGTNTPASLQTGDFNQDGKADLIVNRQDTADIVVLLGDGSGGFTIKTTYDAGTGAFNPTEPPALLVIDFNRDGIDDIVYANWLEDQVFARTGNGDGTFSNPQTLTLPALDNAFDLQAADFDGDGRLEILSVGSTFFQDDYLLEISDSGEITATSIGSDARGFNSVVFDINSDGILDIASAQDGVLYTQLGNGNGTFQSVTTKAFGVATSSLDYGNAIRSGDFNSDGFQDILMSSPGDSSFKVLLASTELFFDSKNLNIRNQEVAANQLEVLDGALNRILSQLSRLGASYKRLESAEASLQNSVEALSLSNSLLSDTDYADEVAELVKQQVRQQAQMAVLSQANAELRLVLQLLSDS